MINEIIFDLETKSFFDETGDFDASKLGVSVVSVYKRKLDDNFKETEGEMISFWEEDFNSMWPLFHDADRIIGFNSKRFDVAALRPYSKTDLTKLPHFDILEHVKNEFGKRVSLDKIAKDTLGKRKIDDPRNAIVYWRKHDKESLRKLRVYCEEDVILTRDIYDHGIANKELKFTDYWNSPRIITVDFSYPQNFRSKGTEKQIGLF